MLYVRIAFNIVKFLVAAKLDQYVAKWVAYFMIGWQNFATEEAKKEFDAGINEVKTSMPEKSKAWDEWRKKAGQNAS